MADLQEKTDRFAGGDGTSLFYRKYIPAKERLQVVVSHGLGEHSGRYGHVVGALGTLGACVWIHDHRGHGRSQGKRGHVNDFDDYVRDLKTMIALARIEGSDQLPLLLLGHSMGGLIALSLARQHPQHIDGLIVSSPLLGVPQPPSPVLRAIVRSMSMVWPTLTLSNRLDPAYISHDTAEVKAYAQSELVHSRISMRWLARCMLEIEAAGGAPAAIQSPILMQVAGEDHMVSASAALAYFDALTVADKTLYHYENLYHELYNEKRPERDKVLDDLRRWIAERWL